MSPFRPTTQQADILRHERNRHGVILAGPGTGKSATVVAYIEQLKDLAASKSQGVRFMTMAASKGLTVQAAIVAAVEEGIMPRPEAEIAEERRLLYVAMTRARNHLFCTWARLARALGAPNVGNFRSHSSFLRDGPVVSRNGDAYIP